MKTSMIFEKDLTQTEPLKVVQRLTPTAPPAHSPIEEAEISVLGGVLFDGDKPLPNPAMTTAREYLTNGEEFSTPRHRMIFAAMIRLADREEPISLATVSAEIQLCGGDGGGELNYLGEIMKAVYTAALVKSCARIVKEAAMKRRARTALLEAAERIKDGAERDAVLASLIPRLQEMGEDAALATAREHLTNRDEWERPLLFDEADVPVIPATILPPPLGEFAAALAASTETDEGQAVMAVLGALSTACGGIFEVMINAGHREPCHAYILTAIAPGNNKSAMVSACTKPLTAWEKKQKADLEPDRRRLISERKTQEKIIERMRNDAARANDRQKRAEIVAEICEMENELPEIPALPKLFLTDATNEAMARFIADQNGRGGVFTDEGGFLVVAGGLHSNGKANIDILLKGFDGGSTRIKRADRELDLRPHLTLCFFVQPAVLQNAAANVAFDGKGLLERFFYYLPKSQLGYRTHTAQPMPEHVHDAFNEHMTKILEIKPAIENCAIKPYQLSLAPDVRKAWIELKQEQEKEFRPGGKLYHFAGWGNKAINSVLRIAGMFHVAKHGAANLTIDADSARRAFELLDRLIPHALAAVSFMGIDQPTADAKELLKIIRERKWERFTRTDIIHAVRGRPLGRKERLDKALPVLEERNIIQTKIKGTATKPATLYTVNPAITGGEI